MTRRAILMGSILAVIGCGDGVIPEHASIEEASADAAQQSQVDCQNITRRPVELTTGHVRFWLEDVEDELAAIDAHCSAEEVLAASRQHYDNLVAVQREMDALARALPELHQRRDNVFADIRSTIIQSSGGDAVALAERSAALRSLEESAERYSSRLTELTARLADTTTRYQEFRPTPAVAVTRLTETVSVGSNADIPTLQELLIDTVSDSRETRHPWTLLLHDAENLRHELEALKQDYEQLAKDYATYDPAAEPFDLAGIQRQIAALAKMGDSIRQSEIQYASRVERVLSGLERRIDALVQQQADEASREAIAQAVFLHKSSVFLDQVNEFLEANSAAAEQTEHLGITLLSTRYRQSMNIISYEQLCQEPRQAWMTTGCNAIELRLGPAHQFIDSTAPLGLQFAEISFPSYGATPESIATIKTLFESGDLAGAIMAHDRIALQLDAENADGGSP